jgi:hypothetical protein
MVTGAASGDVTDVYTTSPILIGGTRVTNYAGHRRGTPFTILQLHAKQAKEIL